MTVIPFGKHKGKTVEQVIVEQPTYFEWLAGQNWAVEKFQYLIDEARGLGGPSATSNDDSPEHNLIQARFLMESFCVALLLINRQISTDKIKKAMATWRHSGLPQRPPPKITATFEGISDVRVVVGDRHTLLSDTYVEIKPSVGDDFPAHMRQIKAQSLRGRRYGYSDTPVITLLYDRFAATNLSEMQVRLMFQKSGIPTIKLSEIEERLDEAKILAATIFDWK